MKQECSPRIAVIGFGAMARSLNASLQASQTLCRIGAALVGKEYTFSQSEFSGISRFHNVQELIDWRPALVVECAGHGAVRDLVPRLLQAGIDCIIVSVGSLSDYQVLSRLEAAAVSGGSRMNVVSGAIGGLDVLRSAKRAGLSTVVYQGVKPPLAWLGTPAAEIWDLANLKERTPIFQGTARESSRLYPKNANVTAAVALAGIGFELTKVTFTADPLSPGNVHELTASGSFGTFSIRLENKPLPENPKTSLLAALSIEDAIARHFEHIEL